MRAFVPRSTSPVAQHNILTPKPIRDNAPSQATSKSSRVVHDFTRVAVYANAQADRPGACLIGQRADMPCPDRELGIKGSMREPSEGVNNLVDTLNEASFAFSDVAHRPVEAHVSYRSVVKRGALDVPPGYFGVTKPLAANVIRPATRETENGFMLGATVELIIGFNVRADLGPSDQINIASADDAAISAKNYVQVSTDLMPNPWVEFGAPPREKFWAKDLTESHELSHVDDHGTAGANAAAFLQTWLSMQAVANSEELTLLIKKIPDLFTAIQQDDALVDEEKTERRAY